MNKNCYPGKSGWYFLSVFCLGVWTPSLIRYFDVSTKRTFYTYRHRFRRYWKMDNDHCCPFIFFERERFDEPTRKLFNTYVKIKVPIERLRAMAGKPQLPVNISKVDLF